MAICKKNINNSSTQLFGGARSDSAFQIDELYRHNQNLVGTLHATSLPWSTEMKTALMYKP